MSDAPTDAESATADLEGEFNDRTLFFLRHRQLIEEWASIADDARAASHRWLRETEQHLHPIAADHGLECRYVRRRSGSGRYSAFSFVGPDCPVAADGVPLLGCELGWNRRYLNLDGPWAPYVGVWVLRSGPGGGGLRDAFAVRAKAIWEEHGYRSDPDWPAWRPLPGGDAWWSDLDGYRARLLAATRQLLERFQPAVADAWRTLATP